MDPNPVTDPTTVLKLADVAGVCALVPEPVEAAEEVELAESELLDPPQAARQAATDNARALRIRMSGVCMGESFGAEAEQLCRCLDATVQSRFSIRLMDLRTLMADRWLSRRGRRRQTTVLIAIALQPV